MTTISFTVYGNQNDPDGNPIPKAKLTRGQQWGEKAQRYVAWKKYVQDAFQPALIAAAIDMPPIDPKKLIKGGRYLKPITLTDCKMDLIIYWKDETHADPESIYGSIADALFCDDKHLTCEGIEYEHTEDGKGRVEVTITI